MSLSVNCMTRGPADRVAAMLALFRPVVDEIFVAIDDRAGAELDAALASVADRIVRYPSAEPVDRPLAWIHAQCSGDWVLTVDDDEIPSRTLLDALPDLVADRRCTHHWLRRRWLYPTAEQYIDAQPWHQDYQLRLVLNDPRVISFPEVTHIPVVALGPSRYLELPLYHADCVLNSAAVRARKARRYDWLRPGMRIAGRPLNEAFYLPEEANPPTAGVPPEDRELIAAVLAPPSPQCASADVHRASRTEIDRHWAGRELSAADYAVRMTLVTDLPPLRVGGEGKTFVLVENLGAAVWPWGGGRGPEIRVGYRWLRPDGSVAAEGVRSSLPADLRPTESQIVPLTLVAPPWPGRYTLVVDLVHEHVRWFEQPLTIEAEVAPARFVALLDPGTHEGLLAGLAALAPDDEPVVLSPAPDELRRTFAGTIKRAPELPTSRLAFVRLWMTYRDAIAGAGRLVVPADALRRERRLPLLAALTAARSLRIPVCTTAGDLLTLRAILRRQLR